MNKVIANTGIILLGNVFALVIGLATNILLVRFLGAPEFGTYSFVYAFIGFFAIITDCGIGAILIRELSQDRARRDLIVGNAIILKLALSLIAFLLSCAAATIMGYPLTTRLLMYLASVSFFFTFVNVLRLLFQVHLDMRIPVVADIAVVAVKLAFIVWLVFLKASLVWFVLAELLSNIPGILIIAYRCRVYVRPSFRIDLALWRFLFKESWPLALSTVLAMIYLRVDQILLFRIKGAAALGYYAPTVKIAELFNLLPIALMATVFPLFAKYHADSRLSLKKAYDASAKYLLALIIPVAGAVTLLADKIILLMYGSEFLPSAPALIILLWSEVFIFAGSVNNKLLISIGKQRVDFCFTGASALLNVGLNLILIPRFSFAGAAMASLAAYALGPVLNYFYKPLRSYARSMFILMLKPLAATILLMAVMYAGRDYLVLSVIAGVLTYIVAMLLLKGISVPEIRMLIDKKIEMI